MFPKKIDFSFLVLGYRGDDLYIEKAGVGPVVNVLKRGERVFYVPQGYKKQVKIGFWTFFCLVSDEENGCCLMGIFSLGLVFVCRFVLFLVKDLKLWYF